MVGTVEPSRRPPTPEPLRLVLAFVNSVDIEERRDDFAWPDGLEDWLVTRGLVDPGTEVSERDRRRAIDAREAIRAFLLANNGAPLDPVAPSTLNDLAAELALELRFEGDGSARLEPQGRGTDAALARILALVYAAMADGTWPRLKACRNDACRWAFYDASKNRSGTWCSMAICGSRTKARTYRRRRSAGLSPR
jgi:predicted RNA-binding Zn ribbon-like protein